MIKRSLMGGAALFAVLSASSAAGAAMLGQQVGYQYLVETSVIHDPSPVLVGAGVELNGLFAPGATGTVDFGDTTVQIDFGESGSFTVLSFNGFRLFDTLGLLTDIIGASFDPSTNMAGLTDAAISFDADNVFVDFSGRSFNPDTNVLLNLTFARGTDVPEPATLALLGLGLAGLGVMRRKAA